MDSQKSIDFLINKIAPLKKSEQTTMRSDLAIQVKKGGASYFILLEFAKKMQKNPTFAEKIMYQKLSQNKISYAFQKVLSPYIVDFFIMSKRLIVEIDGDFHNSDINQQSYDTKRDIFLMSYGFNVWRFTNNEIMNNIDIIIKRIISYIPQKKVKRVIKIIKTINNRIPISNKVWTFEKNFRVELGINLWKIILWKYYGYGYPKFNT